MNELEPKTFSELLDALLRAEGQRVSLRKACRDEHLPPMSSPRYRAAERKVGLLKAEILSIGAGKSASKVTYEG